MAITDNVPAGGWKFTEDVTREFDSHVSRSVPHYATVQDLIASLSDWLAPDGATIADLGASTGETVRRIAERHPNRRFTAYLYDVESHMLEAAREKLNGHKNLRTYFRTSDVTRELDHSGADMTVSSLTLQFLSLAVRRAALQLASRRAKDDGALVLFEKVVQSHPSWESIATELTQAHKLDAGLSKDEVMDKQAAIRGVLIPRTVDHIIRELNSSGWGQVEEVFRWHNWAVFVARKQEA